MLHNSLIISDTQSPFMHPDALDFLAAVADQIKPTFVCHVGDLLDHHAMARNYNPHPNAPSPGDEFEQAKSQLDELEKLFPIMSIAYSNHEARLFKAASSAKIPNQYLKSFVDSYSKPQWEWDWHWSLPWAHGRVIIEHGLRRKNPLMRALELGDSIMQGHHHSEFGIAFRNTRHRILFGAAVGCLCDSEALALAYAKEAPLGQMLGCGAIVDGWPRLFPMATDDDGRWTKTLV